MRFKVLFTLDKVQLYPIQSGYRPGWKCASKPEYNSGALTWLDQESIPPGTSHICILHPFASKLWHKVQVGDVLSCMWGTKIIGTAKVLEIQ